MAGRIIQGSFVGGQARLHDVVAARPGVIVPPTTPNSRHPQLAQCRPTPTAPTPHKPAASLGGVAVEARNIGLVSGGGRPLPKALQAKMEAAFSSDFSAVRVHEGPQAARIGAIAFATGNDLYFAPGRYQPDSIQGQQLIGHELAHVVQQRQGRVRGVAGADLSVVSDRALEEEADRLGRRAAGFAMPVLPPSGWRPAMPPAPVQMKSTTAPQVGPQHRSPTVAWMVASFPQGTIQRMWSSNGLNLDKPSFTGFSLKSAQEAITSLPNNSVRTQFGGYSGMGVEEGDVGSYKVVTTYEKTGDGLTGDHQPSGAAIKEAIRILLHNSLNHVLTRQMARNAYAKAITVVVQETWHRSTSRTYGGRNTKTQISGDASDLAAAAMKDFKMLIPYLKNRNYSDSEIEEIWDALNEANTEFMKTGKIQWKPFN